MKTQFFSMRYLLMPMLCLLVACSEPVIDASSEEQIDKSLAKIAGKLPSKKASRLLMEFSQIENTFLGHAAFRGENDTARTLRKKMYVAIDGLNAEELSKESTRIRQAWVLGDLIGIRLEYEYSQAAIEQLNAVKISKHQISNIDDDFDLLEVSFVNQSKHTIFGVSALVSFLHSGGAIEDTRNRALFFAFPEGLEPNNEGVASIRLRRLINRSEKRKSVISLNSYKVTSLYNSIEGDSNSIIATTGPAATKKDVELAEAKYRSIYGSDEPIEWSANIKRLTAKIHNRYYFPK